MSYIFPGEKVKMQVGGRLGGRIECACTMFSRLNCIELEFAYRSVKLGENPHESALKHAAASRGDAYLYGTYIRQRKTNTGQINCTDGWRKWVACLQLGLRVIDLLCLVSRSWDNTFVRGSGAVFNQSRALFALN